MVTFGTVLYIDTQATVTERNPPKGIVDSDLKYREMRFRPVLNELCLLGKILEVSFVHLVSDCHSESRPRNLILPLQEGRVRKCSSDDGCHYRDQS
jgi:hypothetical protein